MESILRVDSFDEILTRMFRIHDPCLSLGTDTSKVHQASHVSVKIYSPARSCTLAPILPSPYRIRFSISGFFSRHKFKESKINLILDYPRKKRTLWVNLESWSQRIWHKKAKKWLLEFYTRPRYSPCIVVKWVTLLRTTVPHRWNTRNNSFSLLNVKIRCQKQSGNKPFIIEILMKEQNFFYF